MPLLAPIKSQPSPWNTGNELVDMLLNVLAPTDVQSNIMNLAMPPGLGMIARPRTPEQGLILTLMNKYFPQMTKRAIADPRKLTVFPHTTRPDALGYQRKVNPLFEELGISPSVLREGSTLTKPVIGHELQHFLSGPRLSNIEPINASTIASLLQDYVSPGFRQHISSSPSPTTAASEAFSYLGETAARPEASPIAKQLAEALGVAFR